MLNKVIKKGQFDKKIYLYSYAKATLRLCAPTSML